MQYKVAVLKVTVGHHNDPEAEVSGKPSFREHLLLDCYIRTLKKLYKLQNEMSIN